MAKFIKWLRGFGPLGTAAANILVFLTVNWVAVVSAVTAISLALWSNAVTFFHRPDVEVGIGIFIAVLWTLVGLLFLWDRRKPRTIRAHPDYRYGLTFEGIAPFYNPDQPDEAVFALGIALRNYSNNPIRYDVDSFELHIETRSPPKVKRGVLYGYMPRGGARTSTPAAFRKSDIAEFIGKKTTGTADFSIVYGHPERPPERRLTIATELTLFFHENGSLGFNANIKEEKDEAISNH